MLSLFRSFYKENKGDCIIYTFLYFVLALVAFLSWTVWFSLLLAAALTALLVKDFLKWEAYYGNRGKK